jgi:membrane associated rhomboid family serine protease
VLPVGDYPNPRTTQWVTRLLVGLNVAIYLFVSLPLERPLDEEDWRDPRVREAVVEMLRAQAGRDPDPSEIEQAARELSKYDLLVWRYGYKPARPDLLALFTCMFLHAGFGHLFGNMLMLWIFGDNVEARLGRVGYVVAYLLTGVVATLAFALPASKSMTPLVGASGAISGILGFYLIWFPHNQIRVVILYFYFLFVHVRAIWVLGVYLVIQNVLPFLLQSRGGGGGVAHGAHIGGFIAGMVGALLFNMFRGKGAVPHPQPYVEKRPAPWSRPRAVPRTPSTPRSRWAGWRRRRTRSRATSPRGEPRRSPPTSSPSAAGSTRTGSPPTRPRSSATTSRTTRAPRTSTASTWASASSSPVPPGPRRRASTC